MQIPFGKFLSRFAASGIAPAARCLQPSEARQIAIGDPKGECSESTQHRPYGTCAPTKMARRPGAAPGIAGFGRPWREALKTWRSESAYPVCRINLRARLVRGVLQLIEFGETGTTPKRPIFLGSSFLATGSIASGDQACCFLLGRFRRAVEDGQDGLDIRHAAGVLVSKDRQSEMPASPQSLKNEHRCLTLMRQPQVFTTDVSVFRRHTSRGKPLVLSDLEICSHTDKRLSYRSTYIHTKPSDEFYSSPCLTVSGSPLYLLCSRRRSIQSICLPLIRACCQLPLTAGSLFSFDFLVFPVPGRNLNSGCHSFGCG